MWGPKADFRKAILDVIMIRDLTGLFETVLKAQSDQEKANAEAALLEAVKEEIEDLFADPKYSKGKRTFGALKNGTVVFKDNPKRLEEILFMMNYRPVPGREGDKQYWKRKDGVDPIRSSGASAPREEPQPRRRVRWQTVAGIIGGGASLVTIVGFFFGDPAEIYCLYIECNPSCDRSTLTVKEFSECIGTIGGAAQ